METAPGQWDPASTGPASTDNKESSSPLKYRYKLTWNTTNTPLGNNGYHSLTASEQLTFEEWVVGAGWTNAYDCGPAATGATTSNVVVGGVQVTKGTIDYFKWDPESEDSALTDPVITFTITDPTPHEYDWTIYYRETANSGTWKAENYAVTGHATEPGQVTVHLAGADVPGHLDPEANPWGTYTYDIYVKEKSGTSDIDHNELKTPYAMWIPETGGDGKPGHEWWLDEDDPSVLRASHWLHHQYAGLLPQAEAVDIVVVDPGLDEQASVTGPPQVEVRHDGIDEDGDGEHDGISIYVLNGGDSPGKWRVLWTGSDPSGAKEAARRTHDSKRMVVANVARNATATVYAGEASFESDAAAAAAAVIATECFYSPRGITPPMDLDGVSPAVVRSALRKSNFMFFVGHGVTYGPLKTESVSGYWEEVKVTDDLVMGRNKHHGDSVRASGSPEQWLSTCTGVAQRLHTANKWDAWGLFADGSSYVVDGNRDQTHEGLGAGSYSLPKFVFIAACNSARTNSSIAPIIASQSPGNSTGYLGFARRVNVALASVFVEDFMDEVYRGAGAPGGLVHCWDRKAWKSYVTACDAAAWAKFVARYDPLPWYMKDALFLSSDAMRYNKLGEGYGNLRWYSCPWAQ